MKDNNKRYQCVERADFIEILVSTTKPSALIRSVLLFMVLISVLIPLVVIIIAHDKIGGRFLFSVVMFLFVGFYFLKLLLWNLYGSEVIRIGRDYVSIYQDYKYFQLGFKKMPFNKLNVSYIPYKSFVANDKGKEPSQQRIFVFHSENDSISTTISMKLSKMVSIRNRIIKYLDGLPN